MCWENYALKFFFVWSIINEMALIFSYAKKSSKLFWARSFPLVSQKKTRLRDSFGLCNETVCSCICSAWDFPSISFELLLLLLLIPLSLLCHVVVWGASRHTRRWRQTHQHSWNALPHETAHAHVLESPCFKNEKHSLWRVDSRYCVVLWSHSRKFFVWVTIHERALRP